MRADRLLGAYGQADGLDLIISDIGLADSGGLVMMRKAVVVGSVPAIAPTGSGMDEDTRNLGSSGE